MKHPAAFLLGFLLTALGLVLGLTWKDEDP